MKSLFLGRILFFRHNLSCDGSVALAKYHLQKTNMKASATSVCTNRVWVSHILLHLSW
jgi:hypothetical protein